MTASGTQPRQDRSRGSAECFDEHWGRALQRRRVLYPKEVPDTQWELFEREKARHVDRLLGDKRLTAGLVLECGCGTAGMSICLANQGFRTVATDISLQALHLARINAEENATSQAQPRTVLMAADVFRLPFRDMSFDVVMSHGLLEHFDLPSLRIVLGEMVRVLRPGGLFLADIAHGGFSVRKVARWLNLPLALAYYLLRADRDRLRLMWGSYFPGFYENQQSPSQWIAEFASAGLKDTEVVVMRPFPPLDLTASLDRRYAALIERMLPFWHWFDESQSWFTKRWGWLYLAHGIKAGWQERCDSPVGCDHRNGSPVQSPSDRWNASA